MSLLDDAIARLDPQVAALLDSPAGASLSSPDLDALRAGYADTARRLGGPPVEVAHAQSFEIIRPDPSDGAIRARYFLPTTPADGPAGVLVWFHGGGWFLGDLDGIEPACRAIAQASGHAVLAIDYRLVPEHPFPAGLEDCWHAVQWACGAEGAEVLAIDEGRVAVGGDSAGGNLAAVCARRARDAGLPLLGQVLVYPALDPSCRGASHAEFAEGPFLTANDMERCWQLYANGDAQGRFGDPDFAPVQASSLEGLAPAHVAVAEIDPLCSDGLDHADALRAAGVAVTSEVHAGCAHGFLRWSGKVDESRRLLTRLGERTRELLA